LTATCQLATRLISFFFGFPMRETHQIDTVEIVPPSATRTSDNFAHPEQDCREGEVSFTAVDEAYRDSPAQPQEQPANKGGLRKFGSIGLLLFFLFGKLKYLGLILQVGKFKTFISMLISIWAYAMFWGWSFAAGFVALIFIHEMGHVLALRFMGVPATAPMFIPFVGAHIVMKQMPKNAFVEAVGAYGGPLLGTLGAIGCVGIGLATGNLFWFALASSGFLLNLFNLLPISPLDGGRIIGVISPKLWVLGLLAAGTLFYLTWSPIIALILLLGSFQIYKSFKASKTERARYYNVSMAKRIGMGAAFLFLLAVTSIGMLAMQGPLQGI
jgi:Zn-dependent protease